MKTELLTGTDLNRAVAMALGLKLTLIEDPVGKVGVLGLVFAWKIDTGLVEQSRHEGKTYIWPIYEALPDYAGDISAMWPIIKEHKIDLLADPNGGPGWEARCWRNMKETSLFDPDPLVAACRALAHSVYGDDINLEN